MKQKSSKRCHDKNKEYDAIRKKERKNTTKPSSITKAGRNRHQGVVCIYAEGDYSLFPISIPQE